jgi:zona occludens toxin (predicted ATPase)
MAIHIYTGRPGTGKTYVLIRKALEALKKHRHVYCYYQLQIKTDSPYLHYWKSFSELLHVQNGIILLDEAQIWFNSRKWERLPDDWQYKLQQHRKDSLTILGTVQNIKRLDTIVRELVSNYYECKKIFRLIMVREFDISEADKIRRKPLWVWFYFLRKKFYSKYNTYAKLTY